MDGYIFGVGVVFLFLSLCSKSKLHCVLKEDFSRHFANKVVVLSLYPTYIDPVLHPDEFSCQNLAVIKDHLLTDTVRNRSIITNDPSIIKLHVPNLSSLNNLLYQVNLDLEESKSGMWMPAVIVYISESPNRHTILESDELTNYVFRNISLHRIPNLDINSEVFLIFPKSEKQEVYEIYTVKEQVFVKVVSTETFDGSNTNTLRTTIERRRDLEGIIINGVTQDDPTLELLAKFHDVNGVVKFHSGVAVSYFTMMAEGLNFSMGAVRGDGWISQSSNGMLLGMANQLQSGEADVLIAYSELLPYRLKGLKFLQPYYRGIVRAFFQQPAPSEIRNIFLQPLQPNVWLSLLILWILVSISLKFIYELKVNYIHKPRNYAFPNPQPDGPDKVVAEDAFMWGISAACGQGWHTLPQCGVMKLTMFSGLIIYIFTYTAYSAAIVTSLSVFTKPIKSWHDLVNSGLKIYGDTLLESSTSYSYTNKSSRQSIFIPNNEQTTIGVMQALRWFLTSEPFAMISVADQFYQISSTSNYTTEFICQRVSQVPVQGSPRVKGGMTITKSSPFKNLFNYQTILIQERGLDARLASHYSALYTPNCLNKQYNYDTYTLGINDVFTAFAILAGSFLASICVLLCERTGFTHRCICHRETRIKTNIFTTLVEYVKERLGCCQSFSFNDSLISRRSSSETLIPSF